MRGLNVEFIRCNIFSGVAQYVDPMIGFLTPAISPPILYAIKGPIYVEPASLQAAVLTQVRPQAVEINHPLPSQIAKPIVNQHVVPPSPFNPYATTLSAHVHHNDLIDEVRI